MGPASEWGIDHKPWTEDFTENWRHESQTLRTINSASRLWNNGKSFLWQISEKARSFCSGDLNRLTYGCSPKIWQQNPEIKTLKRAKTTKWCSRKEKKKSWKQSKTAEFPKPKPTEPQILREETRRMGKPGIYWRGREEKRKRLLRVLRRQFIE